MKKLCSLWQPTLLPSRIASAERGGGWSARKTRRKVFVGKIVLATCGASRLNAQSTNAHSRPWHIEYSTTPPPSHDSNLRRHLTSQALHYSKDAHALLIVLRWPSTGPHVKNLWPPESPSPHQTSACTCIRGKCAVRSMCQLCLCTADRAPAPVTLAPSSGCLGPGGAQRGNARRCRQRRCRQR